MAFPHQKSASNKEPREGDENVAIAAALDKCENFSAKEQKDITLRVVSYAGVWVETLCVPIRELNRILWHNYTIFSVLFNSYHDRE